MRIYKVSLYVIVEDTQARVPELVEHERAELYSAACGIVLPSGMQDAGLRVVEVPVTPLVKFATRHDRREGN